MSGPWLLWAPSLNYFNNNLIYFVKGCQGAKLYAIVCAWLSCNQFTRVTEEIPCLHELFNLIVSRRSTKSDTPHVHMQGSKNIYRQVVFYKEKRRNTLKNNWIFLLYILKKIQVRISTVYKASLFMNLQMLVQSSTGFCFTYKLTKTFNVFSIFL